MVQETLLNAIVESYESVLERGEKSNTTNLVDFLPPEVHPEYNDILVELIRIEIEHGWNEGKPKSVAAYVERFPFLQKDRTRLEAICFEEYRQRLLAGEKPNAPEYQGQYGVSIERWPPPAGYDSTASSWKLTNPSNANEFPRVGETYLGFELVQELGRGSFARVFLARQSGLSNRPVALKLAKHRFSDAKMLARLQHTNIVPIYSVHRNGDLEAICMPYFGSHTLCDLLGEVRGESVKSPFGQIVLDTVSTKQSKTLRSLGDFDPDNAPERDQTNCFTSHQQSTAGRKLTESTYAEAILAIGQKVALGLSHAHERGIIHGDLKPANILLADDGEAMILDFNLSHDVASETLLSREYIGGTLPYMAPEQLQAFRAKNPIADPRSDIFSLGVILYELLFGSTPYPVRKGQLHEILDQGLIDRLQLTIAFRNPIAKLSPAIESILAKCLAPKAEDRYRSAQELVDDIECQLQDLPLRHAHERSWRERSQKWLRRHPRLTSLSAIGSIACLLLVSMASLLAIRSQRLMGYQSQASWQQFEERLQRARVETIDAPLVDRHALEKAHAAVDNALSVWGEANEPQWQTSSLVKHLSFQQRDRLPKDVAELYFLRATLDGLLANCIHHPDDENRHLFAAIQSNSKARGYNSEVGFRDSLDQQLRWLKQESLSEDFSEDVACSSMQEPEMSKASTRQLCQQACLLAAQHRFQEAAGIWQQVTMREPENLGGWYGLGHSREQTKDFRQATECYSACIALNSDYFAWYFNRGRTRLKNREYALARDDFVRSYELNPEHAESQVNLAIACLELEQHDQAIRAIQQAIKLGFVDSQAYFILSQAYAGSGQITAAQETRLKAELLVPSRVESWIGRGVSRAKSLPMEALNDFDQAIKLNAFALAAYESKANVLAECLNRPQEAVTVLDRAIQLFPEESRMYACRGVLHGRLNQRQPALEDAKHALLLDSSPEIQYQVAGIFALLATGSAEDGSRAIELLASSLRQGYGTELLDSDPDLDPIRDLSEYKRIRDASRTLDSYGLEFLTDLR